MGLPAARAAVCEHGGVEAPAGVDDQRLDGLEDVRLGGERPVDSVKVEFVSLEVGTGTVGGGGRGKLLNQALRWRVEVARVTGIVKRCFVVCQVRVGGVGGGGGGRVFVGGASIAGELPGY